MKSDDATEAIFKLAGSIRDLQADAERAYRPIIDAIVRAGSRDFRHIERTLDGLLGFCGHEPVLQMYKKLCRHYWGIDPTATAEYVHAYRRLWDGDQEDGRA